MPMIRPSSDLRNKYNEISQFCNQYQEPVFITKNGAGDLVIMTNAQYEQLCRKAELHRLLNLGLEETKVGDSRLASDVFAGLETRFDFSTNVCSYYSFSSRTRFDRYFSLHHGTFKSSRYSPTSVFPNKTANFHTGIYALSM